MPSRRQTAEHRQADLTHSNVRAITDLENQIAREKSWSERVSDRISAFAGSLAFVLAHFTAFVCWAAWNALAPEPMRFDPFPYPLLTFIVSLEGVLIATFVLITQNRMNLQSDRRDRLNLQVDMLAEQEMTLVLRMLKRIADHIGVPPEDSDAEKAKKLAEETNVFDLMQQLEREAGKPQDPAR